MDEYQTEVPKAGPQNKSHNVPKISVYDMRDLGKDESYTVKEMLETFNGVSATAQDFPSVLAFQEERLALQFQELKAKVQRVFGSFLSQKESGTLKTLFDELHVINTSVLNIGHIMCTELCVNHAMEKMINHNFNAAKFRILDVEMNIMSRLRQAKRHLKDSEKSELSRSFNELCANFVLIPSFRDVESMVKCNAIQLNKSMYTCADMSKTIAEFLHPNPKGPSLTANRKKLIGSICQLKNVAEKVAKLTEKTINSVRLNFRTMHSANSELLQSFELEYPSSPLLDPMRSMVLENYELIKFRIEFIRRWFDAFVHNGRMRSGLVTEIQRFLSMIEGYPSIGSVNLKRLAAMDEKRYGEPELKTAEAKISQDVRSRLGRRVRSPSRLESRKDDEKRDNRVSPGESPAKRRILSDRSRSREREKSSERGGSFYLDPLPVDSLPLPVRLVDNAKAINASPFERLQPYPIERRYVPGHTSYRDIDQVDDDLRTRLSRQSELTPRAFDQGWPVKDEIVLRPFQGKKEIVADVHLRHRDNYVNEEETSWNKGVYVDPKSFNPVHFDVSTLARDDGQTVTEAPARVLHRASVEYHSRAETSYENFPSDNARHSEFLPVPHAGPTGRSAHQTTMLHDISDSPKFPHSSREEFPIWENPSDARRNLSYRPERFSSIAQIENPSGVEERCSPPRQLGQVRSESESQPGREDTKKRNHSPTSLRPDDEERLPSDSWTSGNRGRRISPQRERNLSKDELPGNKFVEESKGAQRVVSPVPRRYSREDDHSQSLVRRHSPVMMKSDWRDTESRRQEERMEPRTFRARSRSRSPNLRDQSRDVLIPRRRSRSRSPITERSRSRDRSRSFDRERLRQSHPKSREKSPSTRKRRSQSTEISPDEPHSRNRDRSTSRRRERSRSIEKINDQPYIRNRDRSTSRRRGRSRSIEKFHDRSSSGKRDRSASPRRGHPHRIEKGNPDKPYSRNSVRSPSPGRVLSRDFQKSSADSVVPSNRVRSRSPNNRCSSDLRYEGNRDRSRTPEKNRSKSRERSPVPETSEKSTDEDRTQNSKLCLSCQSTGHKLSECPKFSRLSLNQRWIDLSQMSIKPCYRCLEAGHQTRACPLNLDSCPQCDGKIHALLHACINDESGDTKRKVSDEDDKDQKIKAIMEKAIKRQNELSQALKERFAVSEEATKPEEIQPSIPQWKEICSLCRSDTHTIEDCPRKICNKCGCRGHLERDCRPVPQISNAESFTDQGGPSSQITHAGIVSPPPANPKPSVPAAKPVIVSYPTKCVKKYTGSMWRHFATHLIAMNRDTELSHSMMYWWELCGHSEMSLFRLVIQHQPNTRESLRSLLTNELMKVEKGVDGVPVDLLLGLTTDFFMPQDKEDTELGRIESLQPLNDFIVKKMSPLTPFFGISDDYVQDIGVAVQRAVARVGYGLKGLKNRFNKFGKEDLTACLIDKMSTGNVALPTRITPRYVADLVTDFLSEG